MKNRIEFNPNQKAKKTIGFGYYKRKIRELKNRLSMSVPILIVFVF